MHKCIIIGIICILLLSHTQSISAEDTTPPTTTVIPTPSMPNGANGFYITEIEIELLAEDDLSGVNITKYRLNLDPWKIYSEPFMITSSGQHTIYYYSIDNAGNNETIQTAYFDVDTFSPSVSTNITLGKLFSGIVIIIFGVNDNESGIDYVEFYINNVLQHTDDSAPYEWIGCFSLYGEVGCKAYDLSGQCGSINVIYNTYGGIIKNLRITPEIISAYALFVISATKTRYINKPLTLPTNYSGFLGQHLLRALFYTLTEF